MADVVTEADAGIGQVGFEIGNAVGLQVRTALQGQADAIAGAEKVVLLQGDAGDQALHLRVADAEGEAARGLLLDRHIDVDLVFLARHARRIDGHGLEIAEALQADLRAVDGRLRIPGAFELAHLAAHDLVFGMQVALEGDALHVDALARIDLEIEPDLALLAVDLGCRVDLGEGVADVGEGGADRIGGLLDLAPRKDLAGLDRKQLAQVFILEDEVAGELDVGDRVDLAFLDVGDHVHLALVRTHRDLGRIDGEIDVAAVEVERGQALEVAGHLLARILVILRVPRGPVAGVGLEIVADLLRLEGLVADDVQVLDARRLALDDVDGHFDAVAVEVDHGRLHRNVVLAAVVVLAGQFLLHGIELEAVEGFAFGQADALEALAQVFFLEILVAAQRHLGNRRPLDEVDDEDVALAIEADVVEEAGPVQRADRLLGALGGEYVTLFNGQVGEHRAGRDAREAVDADIRHLEAVEGEGILGAEPGKQEQGGDTLHRHFH